MNCNAITFSYLVRRRDARRFAAARRPPPAARCLPPDLLLLTSCSIRKLTDPILGSASSLPHEVAADRRAQIRCADRRPIGAERETGWVHERTQAGTAASPPLRTRPSSLFTGPCFFIPTSNSAAVRCSDGGFYLRRGAMKGGSGTELSS
jgi:hypothetical protein